MQCQAAVMATAVGKTLAANRVVLDPGFLHLPPEFSFLSLRMGETIFLEVDANTNIVRIENFNLIRCCGARECAGGGHWPAQSAGNTVQTHPAFFPTRQQRLRRRSRHATSSTNGKKNERTKEGTNEPAKQQEQHRQRHKTILFENQHKHTHTHTHNTRNDNYNHGQGQGRRKGKARAAAGKAGSNTSYATS